MNLVTIAEYGDLCGEGPLWDVEHQALWWTDCVGQKFYRYDWASKKSKLIKDGLEINGFALNVDGGFIVANGAGIWLWDGEDDLHVIAGQANGAKCKWNDCIADPKGRFLAGSACYSPHGDYPLAKLISLDTDGSVRTLDEGFHLSNGLGFSLDCKTLYFTDSIARTIFAYDYNVPSGVVGNRRVFVQVPTSEGLPDGLTVDAEGYVWSAQWYGSCVVRYDPDGKVEWKIETPAKQTSSLAFGGPDLTDIFITSAAKSEPMPVMPPGYDAHSGYFGGALFHTNLGITGRPEFKANIRMA